MKVFYTTLILTFIFSLISRIFGRKNKYMEWTFIILVIVIFVLVAGLRNNIGDTGSYIQGYKNLATFNGFTENSQDKGFEVFSLILYQISAEPQFMIFIMALITQIGNLITLARYRNYFELQTYMYFTSGAFLVTMSGIRQALASSILFLNTYLIIKGKFISYLVVVLLMSTIHQSALIMIPIYFVARQEAWSKKTLITIVISSIGFLFFYQLVPIVFDMLGSSNYTHYEEWLSVAGSGSSFMRVLVNSVPVILSYIYRDKIKKIWPESYVFINMSLLNFIVVTFSLYNWIFARFSLYFQLYNFVLLPFIIKNCFDKRKERDLIYYLFIICYFIFFYREQVIGQVGLGYQSNFF